MASNSLSRSVPRALKRAKWIGSPQTRRTVATAATAVDYHEPSPAYTPPPPAVSSRSDLIREAKPFSSFLTDTHSRQHDYLRISLTEKCNLRCLYCMPADGIPLSPTATQLTTPEILYLCQLFVSQGVNKIRLTGGEPTVRKDILELMRRIGMLRKDGLKELALTTNGIALWRKLEAMVDAGLTGVNISLDTLDPGQFQQLTRRPGFEKVMKSINRVRELNRAGAGVKLKINCVVMRDVNDAQILPFVEMTKEEDVEVRFIEYMPFGGNKWEQKKMLSYQEMLDRISQAYPGFARLRDKRNDTSKTWQVPGFVGRVGFITSMTHNFCGTCNRLRITSDGNLKVCLHGEAEVSLRDILRSEHGGAPMDDTAFDAIRQIELDRRKAMDGSLSSSAQEGWMSKEMQLLEVIGAAVKRKKAKHAGMGELEKMTNQRPMILIGGNASLAAQARFFSSASRRRADDSKDKEDNLSLASAFGFQSLTGLFQQDQPIRGRYSRPREEGPKPSTPHLEPAKPIVEPAPREQGAGNRVGNDFFRPASVAAAGRLDDVPAQGGDATARPSRSQRTPSDSATNVSPTSDAQAVHSADAVPSPPLTRRARLTIRRQAIDHDHPDAARMALIRREYARALEEQRRAVRTGRLAPELAQYGPVGREGGGKVKQRVADPFADLSASREEGPGDESPTKTTGPLRKDQGASGAWGLKQPDGQASARSKEASNTVLDADEDFRDDTTAPMTRRTRLKIVKEGSHLHNPVVRKSASQARVAPERQGSHIGASAWALSENDRATIDSFSDPGTSSPNTTSARASTPETEKTDSSVAGSRLTHLTESGDAHMVNVGAKPATRRVAVAFAQVRFSNSEPFSLVFENNNKKGDVLGVARIAGIMAAKRTADLIPLCHPIPISKVEVDVKLLAPGAKTVPWTAQRNKYGIVTLQAIVETVGPTGVEMEALTAVSGAALTVYDMCKAVDKSMDITGSRLLYKSGGRSGEYVYLEWATMESIGKRWFEERGMEVPGALANMERSAKRKDAAGTQRVERKTGRE